MDLSKYSDSILAGTNEQVLACVPSMQRLLSKIFKYSYYRLLHLCKVTQDF